jgi:hypothetical protein
MGCDDLGRTDDGGRAIISALAAYVIANAERRGVPLPTVMNLDPKLVYGVAAHLLASGSGPLASLAGAVGDGLLSAYSYSQAVRQQGVAGEDDHGIEGGEYGVPEVIGCGETAAGCIPVSDALYPTALVPTISGGEYGVPEVIGEEEEEELMTV